MYSTIIIFITSCCYSSIFSYTTINFNCCSLIDQTYCALVKVLPYCTSAQDALALRYMSIKWLPLLLKACSNSTADSDWSIEDCVKDFGIEVVECQKLPRGWHTKRVHSNLSSDIVVWSITIRSNNTVIKFWRICSSLCCFLLIELS